MINQYCLRDLLEIIGGELQLGSLPPLGGVDEPIGRIVFDSQVVREGDLFWGLIDGNTNHGYRAEQAFGQGAIGAIVSGRRLEPWAGKFSVRVNDANDALAQVLTTCRVTTATGELKKFGHLTTTDNRSKWMAKEGEKQQTNNVVDGRSGCVPDSPYQALQSPAVCVDLAGSRRNPPSWVGAITLLGRRFLGQPFRQVLHGGAHD